MIPRGGRSSPQVCRAAIASLSAAAVDVFRAAPSYWRSIAIITFYTNLVDEPYCDRFFDSPRAAQ